MQHFHAAFFLDDNFISIFYFDFTLAVEFVFSANNRAL